MHIEGELIDLGMKFDGRFFAKFETPTEREIEIAGINEDEMRALAGHLFEDVSICLTVSRDVSIL